VPAVVSLSSCLDLQGCTSGRHVRFFFRIVLSCTGFLMGQYQGEIAVSISTISLSPSGKGYGITLAKTRAALLCGSRYIAVIISNIA